MDGRLLFSDLAADLERVRSRDTELTGSCDVEDDGEEGDNVERDLFLIMCGRFGDEDGL